MQYLYTKTKRFLRATLILLNVVILAILVTNKMIFNSYYESKIYSFEYNMISRYIIDLLSAFKAISNTSNGRADDRDRRV